MKDRTGQVWEGLDAVDPARIVLVCSLHEEREHHYGYRYRTYLCVDLATGDLLTRSESERMRWEHRDAKQLA